MHVPWTEFGLVLQSGKTSEQHLDCTNFLRTGPDFNDDCKFSFHFKISVKSTAATKGIQLYRSSILFYICGETWVGDASWWILQANLNSNRIEIREINLHILHRMCNIWKIRYVFLKGCICEWCGVEPTHQTISPSWKLLCVKAGLKSGFFKSGIAQYINIIFWN